MSSKIIKSIILIILLSLMVSCYAYRPNLKGLSPEEVIFEFNRILNRIDEPEYFKGILQVTTDEAYKEANTLLEYVLLKDTERMKSLKEEIETLMEYFLRLKIIIINIEKNNDNILANVDYYDDVNKISDLKIMKLVYKKDVWKISAIEDTTE